MLSQAIYSSALASLSAFSEPKNQLEMKAYGLFRSFMSLHPALGICVDF